MGAPASNGKGLRTARQTAGLVSFSFLISLALLVSHTPLMSQSDAGEPTSSADRGGTSQAADKNSPEMASHEVTPTFKVNVKLVLVRIVVHDSQGHSIGKLRGEDFEVFDNRKPQVISQFSVEQPGSRAAMELKRTDEVPSNDPVEQQKMPTAPERFTAYLFDDIHLKFGDLARARDAAALHLASLRPTDRAAIFSTSGQTVLDFTDDGAKLHDTLLKLQPRPVTGGEINPCPDVSYYMGDLIENKHDPQALQTATLDALHCAFDDNPSMMQAAQRMAEGAARRSLTEGEVESREMQ